MFLDIGPGIHMSWRFLLGFYRRGGGLNHVLISVGVGGLQALGVVLRFIFKYYISAESIPSSFCLQDNANNTVL